MGTDPSKVTLRDATLEECCSELARRVDGLVICGSLSTAKGSELLFFTQGGVAAIGTLEVCRRLIYQSSAFVYHRPGSPGGSPEVG